MRSPLEPFRPSKSSCVQMVKVDKLTAPTCSNCVLGTGVDESRKAPNLYAAKQEKHGGVSVLICSEYSVNSEIFIQLKGMYCFDQFCYRTANISEIKSTERGHVYDPSLTYGPERLSILDVQVLTSKQHQHIDIPCQQPYATCRFLQL